MARPLSYQDRLTALLLIASVPPAVLVIVVCLATGQSIYLAMLLALGLALLIGGATYQLRARAVGQLRTLSNLMDGMIHGDFSLRVKTTGGDDALGELAELINAMSDTLSRQRMKRHESDMLLGKVLAQLPVAILALDEQGILTLANPTAARLLDAEQDDLVGGPLAPAVATAILEAADGQVVDLDLPGDRGRYQVRHDEFRAEGQLHRLLFVTDVRGLLRREELRAWHDLVRVFSHEINNSLSPIGSIANTLRRMLQRAADAELPAEELDQGLELIEERSRSLKEFVENYRQLTRVPDPKREPLPIGQLFDAVVPLFERPVELSGDPELEVNVDPVQLQQVLINLLKNADEAMDGDGSITVSWARAPDATRVEIRDQGTGIRNARNLFVPFYTTKRKGSGIGLPLCRQIVEAHGGHIKLRNRADGPGCEAIVELP